MRIALTVAGGGFLWQSRRVAVGLAEVGEIHYIMTAESQTRTVRDGFPTGQWYQIPAVTTYEGRHPARIVQKLLLTSYHCARLLRTIRPDAVICAATSLAIPLCLMGRLLGARIVFVESITRVDTPSLTGTLLSKLRLCDRFYVQWPEASRLYPRAIYRGSLL